MLLLVICYFFRAFQDPSSNVISCLENDLELTSVFVTVRVKDMDNNLADTAVAGFAIDPR